MKTIHDLKQLYEIDDSQWLEETIKLLKNHQFQELDLDNLIEELEDLGKRDRNAVVSLIEQIIHHLLILQYWTIEQENNAVHWQGEIYTFRTQLNRRLNTTLRNYLETELDSIYKDALGFVKIKTQNSVNFPSECPYSLAELLDIEWLCFPLT
ncbi:DUF29 domain-containing protein [Sphaerospermopsis aphanizomenoides BCCUSP55]|uniref:DUF29 domain-containing protein n=1 Tax=Sphaerospermopsis aphanizomenoides TaxID=459663 RepID=UPI000A80B231|nr:DUF29 domain-containing protein [Sphaerospermopsis aphanizomenoides]MBK1987781.1 DUF29 domain-containing protein [Sphaerospermopsis aphanizomenoides BCCUSP55]